MRFRWRFFCNSLHLRLAISYIASPKLRPPAEKISQRKSSTAGKKQQNRSPCSFLYNLLAAHKSPRPRL